MTASPSTGSFQKTSLRPGGVASEILPVAWSGCCAQGLIVVDEPHRKFMPGGEMRARHKHVIVHMTPPFAHKKVQDWLAGKSVKGFFSFNLAFGMIGNTFRLCIAAPSVWLCGRCQGKVFAAYCTYFFEASHKKLVSDIDQDP